MKKTFFLVGILIVSMAVYARGTADVQSEYAAGFQEQFERLALAVQEGTMEKEEAMKQLQTFQRSRNMVNDQEYREAEYCINQVGDGAMTLEQARERIQEKLQIREEVRLKAEDKEQSKDPIREQSREQREEPAEEAVQEQSREQERISVESEEQNLNQDQNKKGRGN